MSPEKIVYPGTFDPLTNGHLDLIKRASKMFEVVVVAVADNPGKRPLFTLDERIKLIREVVADCAGVVVIGFKGLLIDCVKNQQSRVILRGLRAVSDFEYEFQLASMNRRIAPDVETVFLTPSESYTFISASLVKEIARLGGDVSGFLPAEVYLALKEKYGRD